MIHCQRGKPLEEGNIFHLGKVNYNGLSSFVFIFLSFFVWENLKDIQGILFFLFFFGCWWSIFNSMSFNPRKRRNSLTRDKLHISVHNNQNLLESNSLLVESCVVKVEERLTKNNNNENTNLHGSRKIR